MVRDEELKGKFQAERDQVDSEIKEEEGMVIGGETDYMRD